jgi:methyltransferase (TIGR00027 family)
LLKHYEFAINHLKKSLPFIISLILIEGSNSILFSTENWEFKEDIEQLIECWKLMKVQNLEISGTKYVVRDFTSDRFVVTSLESKGHIIGVRDEKRALFAQIEPDGIILFAFREMKRFLDAIKEDKLLNMSYPVREKREDLNLNHEKINQKNNQNIQEVCSDYLLVSRLMAYYRAQELKREVPLIIDPLAPLLAGDLNSYLKDHIRFSQVDYAIVRSHYIETSLLNSWCREQKNSQIVLLGAGLDTRAYRFKPLEINSHVVFEVDLPIVNEYKENLLKEQNPLCDLIRLSLNLSDSNWTTAMIDHGFKPEIPTYWILEGLVYYMEKIDAFSLFAKAAEVSRENSRIFVDLMHQSRWISDNYTLSSNLTDPFSKNIKWGIDIKNVSKLFASFNWDATCAFADDYDYDRDVGQKGMIFVNGKRRIPLK